MAWTQRMLADFERLIRPVRTSVANTIARAVVRRVSDGALLQLLQLTDLPGAPIDGAERFQQYGFSSVPLEGAEAVTLFPNGNRAHPLVVAVDDRRHRPTGLPPGTTCVYAATDAEVRLGTGAAAQGAVRGTQRNTAEQAFLDALNTFVGAMVDAAGPNAGQRAAMVSAIATFKTAAAAAVSTKVKLE